MMSKSSGASYHNRYPYSTKIICEEHETTFHRQVLTSAKGSKEVWQCKVYRAKGRAGCTAPQVRSEELDQIMAEIFTQMMKDKNTIIESLLTILQSVPQEVDYTAAKRRVEDEITSINGKKDHLLELSIAGALTVAEFKSRNETFNQQLRNLESQLATIYIEEQRQKDATLDMDKIWDALEAELCFTDGINSNLVATILEKIVVKKESTKEEIHLDIYLKLGAKFEAIFPSASFNRAIRVDAEGHRFVL